MTRAEPGDAPDPALVELFRQEAEGIVDRLDLLLAGGTPEARTEALRLSHGLKGLAVSMAHHPLRDLARSLEAALVGGMCELGGLLGAVDAARGLLVGHDDAPAAARRAAASLDDPQDEAPAPPGAVWGRRAALRRLLRQLPPLLVAAEEQVSALAMGRDRARARAALGHDVERVAAAAAALGEATVGGLGLGLASALAERVADAALADVARDLCARLASAAETPRLDVPPTTEVTAALEVARRRLGARPDERRARVLELPWPDADRPVDLMGAIDRVVAGDLVLDARPTQPDGRVLRAVIGVAPGRGARRDDEGAVRVPRRRLDRLLALSEQLVGAKARARALADQARVLALGEPDPLAPGQLARQAAGLERELDRLARSTQEAVLRARLVPVRGLFALARAAAREFLARHPDRDAEVEVDGSATEVDKEVADGLVEPLVHLVRNALAHGVEPRDERRRAGKPERAAIRISARATPAGVTLEVEDDGRGLDEADLARRTRGLLLLPGEQEGGVGLAMAAGARRITDDAGRGLGVGSVLERVRAMRGRLVVRATPGRGTRVRLVLPPALATARVLLVRAGSERFALPVDGVLGLDETGRRREDVPMVRLTDLVQAPAPLERRAGDPRGPAEECASGAWPDDLAGPRGSIGRERRMRDRFAVLVASSVSARDGPTREALVVLVDDVLRRDLVVVRPIGRRFAPPGVDGVAVLGDGRLVVVVDPWRLFLAQARGLGHAQRLDLG